MSQLPVTGTIDDHQLNDYGVGVDVHKRFIQVCVIIPREEFIRFENDFPTDWKTLVLARDWALQVLRDNNVEVTPENLEYTLESTGNYHVPIIHAWGGIPHVVNPLLASPSRRKTDVLDARLLAYHAVTGLWPASYMPPPDVQTLRALLLCRRQVISDRSRILQRAESLLLRYGHTVCRYGSVGNGAVRAVVEDLIAGREVHHPGVSTVPFPWPIAEQLHQMISDADHLQARAEEIEDRIRAWVIESRMPHRKGPIRAIELQELLMTAPGVGRVAAWTWMAEVVDPTRFRDSRALAAFAGFDPSLKTSAGKTTSYQRRKGNCVLHHAICNAAAAVLNRRIAGVGQWGYQLYLRYGKKSWMRAVAAVGRRLCVALYHMHSELKPYDESGYIAYQRPSFPNIKVTEMGLSPRITSLLKRNGMERAVQVYDRLLSDLSAVPGVGARTLREIDAWFAKFRTKARKTACSSAGS